MAETSFAIMRIIPPGPFEFHFHELRLQEIYERANKELKRTIVTTYTSDKVQHTKRFIKEVFENYYQTNKLDLNNTVIIEQTDTGDYETFLAISLFFFDPFKIESFLNYHKERYTGDEFENFIEYRVYETMKSLFHLKNDDRYDRIMKWVNESRKSRIGKSKIPKQMEIVANLKWASEYEYALKSLSKRLWKEKFTKAQMDFFKVFKEQKRIEWRKDAEHLCYLLHKLRLHKPPLYKTSKGKGHYNNAAHLFEDSLRKLDKKNYISETIYRFKDRKIGKSIPERNTIDLIISLCLKKV